MTILSVRPAAAAAPDPMPGAAQAGPRRSSRDAGIDAARAACLVVVFVLHAMMVGVSVGPSGPVLENAMDGWGGFAAATWVMQVMPLFFVIGGYAGWSAWTSQRARGATAASFVRGRLERLVRPAIALVAVVAAALAALAAAGVAPEIVATAGFRIGQPLWFLAVYLACAALVPLMVALHERMPLATVAGLVAVVVGVDLVRLQTGIEGIGFANLLFVWLLVQQFGFLLADGSVDRLARRTRFGLGVGALVGLAALTLVGPYSPDLLENLNPPTLALVVLGVAQLMLFSLVRAPLRRWAERPRPSRLVARFGEWGMTLYLWHLPAFVALAGMLLVLHGAVGLDLPEPLSEAWWATRPAWLVVAALATAVLVRVFARFERGRGGGRGRVRAGGGPARAEGGIRRPAGMRMPQVPRMPRVPVAVAVPAGIIGVGVALVIGFAPLPAMISAALLLVALRGSSRRSVAPAAASAIAASPGRVAVTR
ncbi:acyltransferase [Agromyces sp. LHK192]|uniref:acyltransferase family protein n=1 Tax=Agromyces sp. LHK192 TaxID=2498704 RepID=UPI000FD9FF78|nr:acyltransferase [Agromyces sp. LHK192]